MHLVGFSIEILCIHQQTLMTSLKTILTMFTGTRKPLAENQAPVSCVCMSAVYAPVSKHVILSNALCHKPLHLITQRTGSQHCSCGSVIITWCHKVDSLPAWSKNPNHLRYTIVLDDQWIASVVLSSPAFIASSEYTFNLNFWVSRCRAAYGRMTIAETRCAAEFILRIKVEITRLAAGTN